MFWVRLRSGIILMAAAIALLVAGGVVMQLGLSCVAIIGMFELYRLRDMQNAPLGLAGYVTAACYVGVLGRVDDTWLMCILIMGLLVMMSIYVFSYPRYDAPQLFLAFFGVVYVAVMLFYMLRIRLLDNGAFLVWLVFISSWGCDTCAYCAGMLFGKHKMAPVLSPKKSVEGAVGGVIGAALIGVIFALVFRRHLTIFANPALALAVIGALGGLISMVGDLTASAIKRFYEIKDYGTLIPGHGGILDRFDSVIVTAPLVYYLILILQRIS